MRPSLGTSLDAKRGLGRKVPPPIPTATGSHARAIELGRAPRAGPARRSFSRSSLSRVGAIFQAQRTQYLFVRRREDLDLVRAEGMILQQAINRHRRVPELLEPLQGGSPAAFPIIAIRVADDSLKLMQRQSCGRYGSRQRSPEPTDASGVLDMCFLASGSVPTGEIART